MSKKTKEQLTYAQLKQQHLSKGDVYEDKEFPPKPSTLFYSREPDADIVWKRPHEICANPKFMVEGASRFDVRQGELGDCWLLAAIASLSMYPKLFDQVVPPNQTFDKASGYCGVFYFKFWKFGKWIEVIVDDWLPTRDNELVFMHSTEKNEFWSALLEKAYAKLKSIDPKHNVVFGSYEALKGGTQSDALEDFTGGISELYDFKSKKGGGVPADFFKTMLKSYQRASLMGCSLDPDPTQTEAQLPNGLIRGHAYSVTGVKEMKVKVGSATKTVPMVRVRNPWGNESEWNGAWSDRSPEWQQISEAERKEMGLNFDDDGEFWMSFDDFTRHFEKVEICHLGPQTFESLSTGGEDGNAGGTNKKRWELSYNFGNWLKGARAGGCLNFPKTFWTNPQYRVQVVDADEDDDEDIGTIVVGLMQEERRALRKQGKGSLLAIGYVVYRLAGPWQNETGLLGQDFFAKNRKVAMSRNFIDSRQITARHRLPPGNYVIIPSTFKPDEESNFMLRIFSEKPTNSNELDEELGIQAPSKGLTLNGDVGGDAEHGEKEEEEEKESPEIARLREKFEQVGGDDKEMDAKELRDLLQDRFKDEFKFGGFSMETARSMVALLDTDQSGKLGFSEFIELWQNIRLWTSAFKRYDADKSGNFNAFELRKALNAVGYRVSNKIFDILVLRYSDKNRIIEFDDYILCCVRLKTVFDTFAEQEVTKDGKIVFSKDKFMQSVLYI